MDALIKAMDVEAQRMDRRGPAAVTAGAAVLKDALSAAAPRRTGGLAASIKAKPAKHDSINGHYSDVYPDGKDEHGERYATIGSVLEHGRSNMPARPWIRPTVDAAGDKVSAAMAAELYKD